MNWNAYFRTGTVPGLLILALATLFLVTGCERGGEITVLKLGHGLDQTHSVHLAMEFMAERLDEKSGGTMRLDLYPSQQLGTERETLELLQIGSLGLTKVSSSVLEAFVPQFQVFGLPYLFRDDEHRFAVLEGPIGTEILLAATPYNLLGLAYYDAGSRSFYTKNRPIESPEQLSGVKVRVQESPVAMRMVSALGGSPTPISWGELYTALQQGIVDGAENNPPSFYLSRHYEVAPYFSLDEHTAVPDVLLMSTIIWDGLSPEEQVWLTEAAEESAVYQKQLWRESVDEALAALREAGVEIIHPDKQLFADRVAPVYEAFQDDTIVTSLVERIRSVEP